MSRREIAKHVAEFMRGFIKVRDYNLCSVARNPSKLAHFQDVPHFVNDPAFKDWQMSGRVGLESFLLIELRKVPGRKASVEPVFQYCPSVPATQRVPDMLYPF